VNQLENQTLALAGMFQAAVLIDELAVSGNCDGAAFDGSFDSLFTFDADSTEAVFGQVTCLHSGFRALTDYLGGETRGSSRNIAYYVLSMMKLATRILSDPALSEQLFDGLQEIQRRGGEFELPRSSIISKIDGLYQDTISQLEPRILVRGEQNHLLNNDTAARIRSLLLAGIRSAVLWRQLGGSKWKLFLGRKRYVARAREMLDRD
jgi:high frequency lysogenization protein